MLQHRQPLFARSCTPIAGSGGGDERRRASGVDGDGCRAVAATAGAVAAAAGAVKVLRMKRLLILTSAQRVRVCGSVIRERVKQHESTAGVGDGNIGCNTRH